MRHKVFGKKLSRTKNERRRLFMILARELIIHNGIVTTLAKARALRPMVEKLVTNAKKNTNAGNKMVRKFLADRISSNKLIKQAGVRFKDRQGGYLRITKLGSRLSDATEMVRIEFVDQEEAVEKLSEVSKSEKTRDPKKLETSKIKSKKKIITQKTKNTRKTIRKSK